MLIIGSHVSFDKKEQLLKSTKEAISYGSNTFMFYTGAPQNTMRSKIEDGLTLEALTLMRENEIDFSKVIVHAPYIINLANNTDKDKIQFSIRFLKEELERCEELGVKYLVLHPGSHVGSGVENGISSIQSALHQVLMNNETHVMILLETMAGKGSELGTSIDQLKEIIDGVEERERLGICLDTCHLNDAGYDLTKFDDILKEIDEKIGLDKVKCVHVNDSKNPLGSHKDRHENIGLGTIGFETLLKIIYHEKLEHVPKILETPYIDHAYPPYKLEIKMIRERKENPNLIEDIKKEYQK